MAPLEIGRVVVRC